MTQNIELSSDWTSFAVTHMHIIAEVTSVVLQNLIYPCLNTLLGCLQSHTRVELSVPSHPRIPDSRLTTS